MNKPKHKLFDSIAGGMSYMPASNEGCAVLLGWVVLGLGVVGIGELASHLIGSNIPALLSYLTALGIFVAFMRFAKKHS